MASTPPTSNAASRVSWPSLPREARDTVFLLIVVAWVGLFSFTVAKHRRSVATDAERVLATDGGDALPVEQAEPAKPATEVPAP